MPLTFSGLSGVTGDSHREIRRSRHAYFCVGGSFGGWVAPRGALLPFLDLQDFTCHPRGLSDMLSRPGFGRSATVPDAGLIRALSSRLKNHQSMADWLYELILFCASMDTARCQSRCPKRPAPAQHDHGRPCLRRRRFPESTQARCAWSSHRSSCDSRSGPSPTPRPSCHASGPRRDSGGLLPLPSSGKLERLVDTPILGRT